MALLLQQCFLVAADLMFASALSCLFYAVGSLVVTGLVGYVFVLSCGAGLAKKAKRNTCKVKDAVLGRVSHSCVGRTVGKILALAGLRGAEEAPLGKEERARAKQPPAGEKEGQKAVKNLTGSHLPRTGMSGGTEMQSSKFWEERETSQAAEPKVPASQKKVSTIPVFLLSLLFASLNWCLTKRPCQWLVTLLTTQKKSRD